MSFGPFLSPLPITAYSSQMARGLLADPPAQSSVSCLCPNPPSTSFLALKILFISSQKPPRWPCLSQTIAQTTALTSTAQLVLCLQHQPGCFQLCLLRSVVSFSSCPQGSLGFITHLRILSLTQALLRAGLCAGQHWGHVDDSVVVSELSRSCTDCSSSGALGAVTVQ